MGDVGEFSNGMVCHLLTVFIISDDQNLLKCETDEKLFFQYSPARFHATLVMKLILSHIITNYDCRLETPNVPCSTTWRSYNLPKDETRIVFEPR